MAHIPYGYRIKNGVAFFDKGKAPQVKALFDEYVGGLSLEAAANIAGIPRRHASLGRMIADTRYLGDGFYPAIIDGELFNKAQEERQRRREALGRNKNYFAYDKSNISSFWGRIFCAQCGGEYRRYAEDGKERWRCGRRIVKGRLHCNSPMIPEPMFEAAFMELLRSLDMEDVKVKPPKKQLDIEQKYDDPIRQAEYAYSLVEVDDFDYQTEKLLAALENAPADFDGVFMAKVIKAITVSHSGTAVFELINGKTFERGLMLDDGRQKCDSDTGKNESEPDCRGECQA